MTITDLANKWSEQKQSMMGKCQGDWSSLITGQCRVDMSYCIRLFMSVLQLMLLI